MKALDQYEAQGTGASITAVARARRMLAEGSASGDEVVRLEEVYRDGPSRPLDYELAGGDVGRRWVAGCFEKGPSASSVARSKPQEPAPELDRRALRRRLSLLLGAHGEDGAPLEAFREHVVRHGHKAVAGALRDLGVDHQGGRVKPGRQPPAKVNVAAQKPVARSKVKKGLSWRPVRFRGVGE